MTKIERVRASANHMIEWVKKPHGSISNKVLVSDLAEDALSLCDDLEVALEALERIAGRRVLDDRYTADANDLIVIAQTTLDKIRGKV